MLISSSLEIHMWASGLDGTGPETFYFGWGVVWDFCFVLIGFGQLKKCFGLDCGLLIRRLG